MKRLITLLIVTSIIVISSCGPEARLNRKEDRLIGTWIFDRVTYRDYNDWFRDNVTRDFAGDIIEFYPDYTAIYDDASLNEIFPGWWEVLLDRDEFFDGNDTDVEWEFFLDMCFEDFVFNEEFCYFGSICRVTRNRLVIEASTRRGEWIFRLDRI